MAIADVFDALSCKRHYKEAFAPERVRAIIWTGGAAISIPGSWMPFCSGRMCSGIAEQYRD